MTNPAALQQSRAHYDGIKERLLKQYESLHDDEETLHDTLDGETDLTDQLIAIARSSENDQILVDGIKARIKELGDRANRIGLRQEKKKELVTSTMVAVGRKSIEAPDFTISLANSPQAVIITDEKLIPSAYLNQPDPPAPKPDRKKIKDALQGGVSIPGATLNNGAPYIKIRKS